MPAPGAEEAGFLEAIREHPEEDGPRLVYADWLDERGDVRGDFIRAHCLLEHLGPLRLDPEIGWDREVRAYRRAVEDWLGPDHERMTVWLERGLPAASLPLGRFLAAAEAPPPDLLPWLVRLRIHSGYRDRLSDLSPGVFRQHRWWAVLPPCQVELESVQEFDRVLTALEALPRLVALYLVNSRAVSEGAMARLACRAELAVLVLNGTPLTDAGLAHLAGMPRLHSLCLRGTATTDAGLAHLADLPRLRRLILRGTRATMAGVEQLLRALPDCRIDCDPAVDPRYRRLHEWRGLEPG